MRIGGRWRLALAAALLLGGGVPLCPSSRAFAQGISATAAPAPGSAQRRAILDALRPSIDAQIGSDVEFVVREIRVVRGWALVIADPQRPGGGAIEGSRYFSADDWEVMDGLTVNGVLRFSGGRWRLVDHAVGPTDVWYCGVEGPPRALTGC